MFSTSQIITNIRPKRAPIPFVDERGRECLKVPLGGRRGGERFAIVEARDYQRIREAGAIGSWYWNSNGKGKGRGYVRTCVPIGGGKWSLVQVARIIDGTGAKAIVRYANGDTLDLRSSNLLWERGKAKRNDVMVVRQGKAIRQERRSKVGA